MGLEPGFEDRGDMAPAAMTGALSLDRYVRFWARWQPHAPAVESSAGSLSWLELDRHTDRLRAPLIRLGVGRGAIVGILMGNSPDYIEAAVAVLKLGGAIAPLNPRYTAAELQSVAADSQLSAIISDGDFIDRLAGLGGTCPVVPFERLRADGADTESTAVSVRGDDIAVIAYTSGTTGQPKGVMLSHANIGAAAYQRILCEGQATGSRILLPTALGYTGGLVVSFLELTLVRGGCLVLQECFEVEACLDAIEARRINYLNVASPIAEMLARSTAFATTDLSSLRSICIGGTSISLDILKSWNARGVPLCQSYGQTETAGGVTFLSPGFAVSKLGSSGMALPYSELRIGQGLPPGEIGEILVRSPAVMRGYFNNPSETAAVLGDGWLRTGDNGRLDEDGFLTVVGRIKQMIISGGLNIYPAEIEKVIEAVPGVVEVAVIGVPDDKWGEVPLALVHCTPGNVDRAAVIAAVGAKLADYKRPKYLVLENHPLPRNAAGKVLITEIKARFRSAAADIDKARYVR